MSKAEWGVLFMGSVGSGKTEAVRALSDTDVIDTDVKATDEVSLLKANTTVSMDVGLMQVGSGERLVLYGAPGQDRFDFMWDILLLQARGLVLLLDHHAQRPLENYDFYVKKN